MKVGEHVKVTKISKFKNKKGDQLYADDHVNTRKMY